MAHCPVGMSNMPQICAFAASVEHELRCSLGQKGSVNRHKHLSWHQLACIMAKSIEMVLFARVDEDAVGRFKHVIEINHSLSCQNILHTTNLLDNPFEFQHHQC
jgi:hypothetical protein